MKKIGLFTSFALVATAAAQTPVQRPNVVLLVADDLGYGDLSCYGAQGVQTPCIDSIARGGVRFVDAHTCASTSTPSRYSLLTGEYPFRKAGTGIAKGDERMIIAPDQYTVADVFHEAGYATGAVGKWHLGLGSAAGKQDWNGLLDQHLGDLGFDYHYIMAATADRVPCAFIENGRIANYDASAPIYVSYKQNFPGEPTGKDHPELLTKLKSSHGHNQAIVNGIGRIGYMKGGGKALWADENIADSISAHAIRFMERHVDEPFFLYLATNDVHVPRYPHERFRGKSPMGLRGDAILQFDWTVQQVVNALQRLGLAENTLLIITSDNGPVLDDGYQDRAVALVGDHQPSGPFRGGKYSVYEGGTAVPFIVNWPGQVPAGKESRALVSQIDHIASMAQLVGVKLPQGAARDSRPQLDTWLGNSDVSCPFALAIGSGKVIDVRQGKWKYIAPKSGKAYASGAHFETDQVCSQLYDLSVSVKENENITLSQRDKVVYFENLIDSVLHPCYPISFDSDQVGERGDRVLRGIAWQGAVEGIQRKEIRSPKIYTDATQHAFLARAGETVMPLLDYQGEQMNGYVYIDYNNDGVFQTHMGTNAFPEDDSELVSFSYYGADNATVGKNSLGETLSGRHRFVLNPPSFTLPEKLPVGRYRVRFKVDYNDVNPNGSSSMVEESGNIVDFMLNIHGEEAFLQVRASNGRVVTLDGKDILPSSLPFGKAVSLRLVPDDGYEIAGLWVKHGYGLEKDSLFQGNVQWQRTYFDREAFDGDSFTIPSSLMDGEVEVEANFVVEGSYVKPGKPTRYQTTTLPNGAFSVATPWYSMQISSLYQVLSDNGSSPYISLDSSVVEPRNSAHLWCFVGNEEEGYRIYNRQAGPWKVLAAPVKMKGRNGGSSYPVMVERDRLPEGYVDVWRFEDSSDLEDGGKAYAYLYEDGFVNHKLNKREDRLAFWCTGKDAGSTLTIRFVGYEEVISGIEPLGVQETVNGFYDVSGRRVPKTYKGVLLNKGIKVLHR